MLYRYSSRLYSYQTLYVYSVLKSSLIMPLLNNALGI